MKILFISMPSIHVIRWIENLKDTSFELYWFDVIGRGKLDTIDEVYQFLDLKKRKIPYIKGEYWLSKKLPTLYDKLQPFLEVTANEALAKIIEEIQPHIVHSFEMQGCSYPILKTMNKYPHIKWIYSCWGSDLFYYQQIQRHQNKIKNVLERVDYIHTDCERDAILAKEMGFKGKHLGVIPGGAGYKLEAFEIFKLPLKERKIILVKGYEHKFGKAINVIKALAEIKNEIKDFEVVVFGSHQIVREYIIENQLPYKCYNRHELSHAQLMVLMGKSLIYVGNSISDGMPNTLLEAIIMGAFTIQSNPGNVTSEIIIHNENGYLIENPNDINSISNLIVSVLHQPVLLKKAFKINQQIAKDRLAYGVNQQKIIDLYQQIENEACD
ncbi:MAG: glycosyltransferase [Flavobacteriaceae bacterium]|nr:glycosyltransferase [Flavobacteriaceae bacterium]